MAKRMRPCCVPECSDKTSPRFNIPMDEEIRKIWIQRINNEHFLTHPVKSEFFNNYRVCKMHFANFCFDEAGRLKKYSLPTMNLRDYSEPSNEETCFQRPVSQHYVTPEKVKAIFKKMRPVKDEAGPSVFREDSGQLQVKHPEKVYRHPKRKLDRPDCSSSVGTSDFIIREESHEVDQEALSALGVGVLARTPSPPPDLGQQIKRKRNKLLQIGGVTRQLNLTPKAKAFYKRARELQTVAAKLKFSQSSLRKKLQFFGKPNNQKLISYMKDVNEITANFFMSQQRTQKHKPRGRRFNIDDKIFALSLYKQSGRAYRYLSKIFSLPSRKTLSTLLNRIPFNSGINNSIFSHLKNVVKRMSPLDKNCVLMFDEISLEPGLQYNRRTDVVEGLVDYGGNDRLPAFADHALVFLLKGIRRKWKQPICFTFCEGTTPTVHLVRTLKNVVREVRNAGLHIVATICDQGATNKAAINILLNETNEFFLRSNLENRLTGYVLDGEEIVHMYDFPHLLKGIRNNLITKNLHFIESGKSKVASWAHMVRLYEIDKRQGPYSQFYKLTDEHVVPGKIRKMKVKNCTQIFSHTVGSAMYTMAKASMQLSTDSEFYLEPKAVETAHIFLFFDKLFDSVNGSSLYPPTGKQLRCVATSQSQHLSFWKSCIPVLDSMCFISTTDPSKKFNTPSLKNWIFSLKGLINITENLFRKGFKHVSPRNFNQDPIENLFSSVRSHGVRNTNPTSSSFISSVKSLLVNNFVSSHSVGSNCEEDESIGVLDTLKVFVKQQENVCVEPEPPTVIFPVFPPFRPITFQFVKDYATAFVAGYVAKKILDSTDCPTCTKKICTDRNIPQNILISGREYEGSHLTRPSSIFAYVFRKVTEVVLNYLPTIVTTFKIKEKLLNHTRNLCFQDISTLFCDNHVNNVEIFLTTSINIIFFNYLKNINKILAGKDLRRAGQDPLTSLALKKYRKRFKR